MDSNTKIKDMPVIQSILSRAEESIYTATGFNVKVVLNDEQLIFGPGVGIGDLMNTCTKKMCSIWKVSHYDIFDNTRKREKVAMRQIVFHYIKYKYPSISVTAIGEHFGGYDHTTIIHNIAKAKSYIGNYDPIFNSYFEPIKHLYNEHK